jgi:hypothetical protein
MSYEPKGELVDEGIEDVIARLEKKRISKGGDPQKSPLPAMRKYHGSKKKKVKKGDWIGPPPKKQETKEEVETIDEISKATLSSYIQKGSRDAVDKVSDASRAGMAGRRKEADKKYEKGYKRLSGVRKATIKLQYKKEEVDSSVQSAVDALDSITGKKN